MLKAISLSILRPIMVKHHAIELEPELFVFQEAFEAVLAVLDAKVAIAHFNQGLTEEHKKDTLHVHGWGKNKVSNHNTFDPTVRPVSTIGNH